jgi:tetratricopeptide (TPR) repeat protein
VLLGDGTRAVMSSPYTSPRPAVASRAHTMRRPTLSLLRAITLAVLLAPGLIPPAAVAFAEVGTRVAPAELRAAAGGKAALLSPSARANVLVFFRPDQDRSVEALRQLAGCEKELGSAVHWAAVVSGSASAAEARAAAAAAGVKMAVLLDEGDQVYNVLKIRLFPAVVITDGGGVLRAVEPYRQLGFADAVRAKIRFVLGEIDEAALNRVLNPEASPLPGSDPLKKAMRDVNMAKRLIEFGKYDAAVKQAQKALERAPVGAAYPVLATAYAKLGRCADAERALEMARKVGADPHEIAAARALCAGR